MKETVEERGINVIWHFTRLSNLDNILKDGLINRRQLISNGTPTVFNDQYRLDDHEDAICCSIEFPNYKMFYQLRQANPDTEWVVIGLKPSILWEKDCAFCTTNAASKMVTSIPIEKRKGEAAFKALFEEIPGKPTRSDLAIPDAYPTNPQAEVLVFGNIETSYFIGVVTQAKEIEILLKALYPDFCFLYSKAFFSPRIDYMHWK